MNGGEECGPKLPVAAASCPQYSGLMLSSTMTASLATLVATLEEETLSNYDRNMRVHEADMTRKGLMQSSVHMQFIDRIAAEAMQSAAEALLREVLDAHGAEPTQDLPARLSQLGAILRTDLERLGEAMTRARDQRLLRLNLAGFNAKLEELPDALARLQRKMHAKMVLGATAISNGSKATNTTLNVHGPVGAIQTGDRASANVHQSIHQPSREEALLALTELEVKFRANLVDNVASDALEMVADLRAQAERSTPNPLKVSSLLGGLATLVQTVPAVAPAWQTITQWGVALRSVTGL